VLVFLLFQAPGDKYNQCYFPGPCPFSSYSIPTILPEHDPAEAFSRILAQTIIHSPHIKNAVIALFTNYNDGVEWLDAFSFFYPPSVYLCQDPPSGPCGVHEGEMGADQTTTASARTRTNRDCCQAH
jgi:hypothetical protein